MKNMITPSDLNISEAKRWMHKGEDLGIKCAEVTNELFKTVGMVRVLFKSSNEINKEINRLYNYETLTIERPTEISDSSLQSWKKSAMKEVQGKIEQIWGQPLIKIIQYIDERL